MASRSKANDESDIDRLFELPPEEFIAARDELAKRLKGEGRTEDAAQVRSLRRPTVAAWAANQVARRHPEDVKELLEAGVALRQAQRKVLSGVRAGGFREGMERRRQVVNRLTKAAEKVLRESGHASAGTAVSRSTPARCFRATGSTGYTGLPGPTRPPTPRRRAGPTPAPTTMCATPAGQWK